MTSWIVDQTLFMIQAWRFTHVHISVMAGKPRENKELVLWVIKLIMLTEIET